MEVRRRNVGDSHSPQRSPSQLLQSFDVFTKMPDDCKKSTSSGGAVTLLVMFVSLLLIISEIRNYVDPKLVYTYEVDKEFDSKIQINIDITVASKCEFISLDLLDLAGSAVYSQGRAKYKKASFELNEQNREAFERRKTVANALRTTHHAVPEMLWKRDSSFTVNSFTDTIESDEIKGRRPYDACNIVGTFHVQKVAGNMHVLPGRPFDGPGGSHVHIAPFVRLADFNFSHRINHLSFGAQVANRVNPLDAVEEISYNPMETFRYYISIVPTRVVYAFSSLDTYQYAITVKNRTAEGNKSDSIPGIFFSYDTFPLLVQVTESRELFGTFLARLAALVGGLFATVGFIRQVVLTVPQVVLESRPGRRWSAKWNQITRKAFGAVNGDIKLHQTPEKGLLDPDSAT
ncbi:Endoplasmic reticulum-Golgi intermediate compartment protein 2 [Clonorchis sinensis]|uniref:Endoplasmic reticulum-Golgi intermediate compartment protein 2 n=1 Tax=Clonorchis sinensis TaxID=79923 RepID=A0A8T1LYQ2_CLOSI|nr:Endoplasmic reticulum-Golgi intermediate compartment protein 2 [Clonorchis sinensis]